MWKEFLAFVRQLIDLMGEIRRLRAELTEVQDQLELKRAEDAKTSQHIRDIANGLLHLKETERLEREKLMLRLELELTKFDRRLPPGKDSQE